jgi:hypothetical protein
MSNILTDKFPRELVVAGETYPILWDARTCLSIMIELEKQDLAPLEQAVYIVQALYDTEVPAEFDEAFAKALWFMHGGHGVEEARERADSVRTFSYEKDAELIYSAFSTRHNIDLAEQTLHWWRFRALFTDLRETTFSGLCDLRRRYKLGECNEKELEAIDDLGDQFVIDDAPDLDWEKHRNMTAYEMAEAGIHG